MSQENDAVSSLDTTARKKQKVDKELQTRMLAAKPWALAFDEFCWPDTWNMEHEIANVFARHYPQLGVAEGFLELWSSWEMEGNGSSYIKSCKSFDNVNADFFVPDFSEDGNAGAIYKNIQQLMAAA